MRIKLAALSALACLTAAPALFAQARAAGVRTADLQIGGGYSFTAPTDIAPQRFKGPYIYLTYDFRYHWGVDLSFHQVNDPTPQQQYERSYEIGPRYIFHVKERYAPYLRVTYGRMVINFPYNTANLAYNMYGIGGGMDVRVHKHVNVRGDFQHQMVSYGKNGLTPNLISIGAAYHF